MQITYWMYLDRPKNNTNSPEAIMDRLSEILDRFAMNADIFFSGNLCGVQAIPEAHLQGHLHLLKSGVLQLDYEGQKSLVIDQPAVIYFSRSCNHHLKALSSDVDLVCANISYQDQSANPLVNSLPCVLHYSLAQDQLLNQTAEWIFAEAFNNRCGKKPMIERLCDVFMIQILRHIINSNAIEHGLLAALANPQLAGLLTEIHKYPEKNWTLEEMAQTSAMSRSKFAATFKQVLGQTPADYLSDWRILMAQNLLKENKQINYIAHRVGYENGSVLARVFRKKTGLSPSQWLQKNRL